MPKTAKVKKVQVKASTCGTSEADNPMPCSRLESLKCYCTTGQFSHVFPTNGEHVEFELDIAVCLFPLSHGHHDTSNSNHKEDNRFYVQFDLLVSRESVRKILGLYKVSSPTIDDKLENVAGYHCCLGTFMPSERDSGRSKPEFIHYRDLIQFLYSHQQLSVAHLGQPPKQFSKQKADGTVVVGADAQKLTEAIALAGSLTDIWRRQWQTVRPGRGQWDDDSDPPLAHNGTSKDNTKQPPPPKRPKTESSCDDLNIQNQISGLEKSTLHSLDLVKLQSHLATGIQLQPHQEYGVRWMYLREQIPFFNIRGGILADVMGLGKTIQAFSLIVASHNTNNYEDETRGVNLIVCKLSILHQWSEELQKFFPHYTDFSDVFIAHKSANHPLDWNKMALSKEDPSRITLLLTTYDQIRAWHQKPKCNAQFLQQSFHRIILDEGHQIATATSATAVAVSSLRARYRWVLSGSPYRNSPRDLYSLAVQFLRLQDSFLDEDRFGRKARWNRAFTRMDALRDWEETKVIPKFNLSALSIRDEARVECWLNVLLLRRTQSDVQSSLTTNALPDRIDHDHSCQFSEGHPEFLIYNHVKSAVETFVLEELGETFTFTSVHGGVMLLRRICVSIDLLLKSEEDGRAMWKNDTPKPQSDDDSVDCTKIQHLTKHHLLQALPSRLKQHLETHRKDKRRLSSKYSLVKNALENVMNGDYGKQPKGGIKVVVFSQWSGALDLMEDLIMSYFSAMFEVLRIDGATPGNERAKNCAIFNESDSTARLPNTILLLNYKAAGEGLNLQSGQHVFLLDPWFTPSVEDQAVARVHRQGNQNDKVNIHRFVVNNSIEQRVQQISDRKRNESNRLLSMGLVHRAKMVQNTIDFSRNSILHLLGTTSKSPG